MASGFVIATFGSTVILFLPKTWMLLGGADVNENFEIVKKSSLYCDSKGAAGSKSSPTNYAQNDDVASSIKTQAFFPSAKKSAFDQLEIVGQNSITAGLYSERDGIHIAGKRRNVTLISKNYNSRYEEGLVEEMRVSNVTESHPEYRSVNDEKC